MSSVEKTNESSSEAAPAPAPAYKTKRVQFLGRSTPIVLQDKNGPCPLLAICNVLLLRSGLAPLPDSPEVVMLLAAVAEKLLDSNSHIQRNVGDVLDLLPKLATGIDVNVKFNKASDFEFTRECAIFDLLDIGLYHGWIVDPQDTDTAAAIGSKSYNELAEDLVSFDPKRLEGEGKGSRKEDKEEEEELTRVLNLSKAEISSPVDVTMSPFISTYHILEGSSHIDSSISGNHAESFVAQYANEAQKLEQLDLISPHRCNASNGVKYDGLHSQSVCEGSVEFITSCDLMESVKIDGLMPKVAPSFQSVNGVDSNGRYAYEVSQCTDLDSSDRRKELPDVSVVGSSVFDNEPIYEGEEHIHDSTHSNFEDREPVYEGEIVLAKQSDKMEDTVASNSRITQKEYYLIKDFLDNNASQLTIYGLFCLKEGLKERELCVLFRNNHFSTMFKFNGELYLLATDEGYICLPDLVWEKLNVVNGDTVFMTGNFTEFKIDDHVDDSWDEQSAIASTADYLAKLEFSEPTSSSSERGVSHALLRKRMNQSQMTSIP